MVQPPQCGACLAAALALLLPIPAAAAPPPAVTFNRDVAPIVHEHCTPCHRPGESGPFELITFQDIRRRSGEIALAVRSRYMPPWLPLKGYGEFIGERGLTDQQIATLLTWINGGMAEGDPADRPPPPTFTPGWQLGEPDLVVEPPMAYVLPAEGNDIFRNLVIPVEIDGDRWVRTVELRPGNPRIVHHAIMRIDRTRSSRLLEAQDGEPGFGSMNMGDAVAPDGHTVAWTPGMTPNDGIPGAAWSLQRGTDLVLQLHMLPTGKPEPIRPRIGLYFADAPPTRTLWPLVLKSRKLDIPAGEKSYIVEDRYDLPVDVEVYSVLPHAHYVARAVEGWATLPDGSRRWLIRIDDWDFDWQDQYRYVQPLQLPAGSSVQMRFVYDNSADNVRNPNFPPQRVVSGFRSTDEMCTMTLEIMPRNEAELAQLKEATMRQDLEQDPEDWLAHQNLGTIAQELGRIDEAIEHFRRTLELNPTRTAAMNNLAMALKSKGRPDEALALLRRALELNPFYALAHYNLGVTLVEQGRPMEALVQFRDAVRLKPYYADAYFNIGSVLLGVGRPDEAIGQLQLAARYAPDDPQARGQLAYALTLRERYAEAMEHFRRALELTPDSVEVNTNVANALLMQGRFDEAITHYRRALELDPGSADVQYNLREALAMQAEIEQAIRDGEAAAERSGRRDPAVLEQLAAIYAAAGRFEDAVATAERALELATTADLADQTARLRQQIRLYRQRRF